MDHWRRIAAENAEVARALTGVGQERSSVSRAYYAVYAFATSELRRSGLTEFGSRGNPTHAQLPKLARHGLSGLGPHARREVSQALRRLRTRREVADYSPGLSVDRRSRLEAVRDLELVVRVFGGVR